MCDLYNVTTVTKYLYFSCFNCACLSNQLWLESSINYARHLFNKIFKYAPETAF